MRNALIALVCVISSASWAGLNEPWMHPLKPIGEATEAIQKAAKAVVRIELVDGVGTGFMVNGNGMLATNNHVLGADNCAKEGCYVKLDFDFKAGSKFSKDREFYAVPVHSVAELDINFFQIYKLAKGKKDAPLKVENFIPLVDIKTPKLKDDVVVVGHPHGALKSWHQGKIYSVKGDWFYSDLCIVGGHSGSPILSTDGKLVGIVHRGSDVGAQLFRFDGAQTVGVFSGLKPLESFYAEQQKPTWKANLDDNFISTGPQEVKWGEDGEILDLDLPLPLYLTSHLKAIELLDEKEKKQLPIAALLRINCQAEIKSDEAFNDPDFDYGSCVTAFEWMNCNDPKDGEGYKSCPNKKESKEWRAIFTEIAEIEELKNQDPLEWAVFAPGILEKSESAARTTSRERLKTYLARHAFTDEATRVLSIIRTSEKKEDLVWENFDALAAFRNFKNLPNYDRSISEILASFDELAERGWLTLEQADQFVKAVVEDPKLPVFSKLEAEAARFESEASLQK